MMPATVTPPHSAAREQRFFFVMSVLIAVVIFYGFSQTVDSGLIHAKPRRPAVLYLHGLVFGGWVAFFVLQSALIRVRRVRLHRTLGLFGVVFGLAIPLLGFSTAVTMTRFHGVDEFAATLLIAISDIIAFTVLFWAAICWRGRPEYHRRLMFVAACVLTGAAFSRFPIQWLSDRWFYLGTDLLVLTGAFRDLWVLRRVNLVYLFALPSLALIHLTTMYLYTTAPPLSMELTDAIMRAGSAFGL